MTAPERIASPANPRLKRLRGLALRKHREETGLCLAEGVRVVTEALDRGHEVETLVVEAGTETQARLAALIRRCAGAEILLATPQALEKLARRDNPQTAIAAIRQRWATLDAAPVAPEDLWVALDRIRDPGNLGTILRTADAVAAAGVVLIGQTCDPYSVEAVRASMGSVFAQRLVRADWPDFLAWTRARRLCLIGTALPAREDWRARPWPRPLCLLMGTEQSGLGPEQQAACDRLVRIPMWGHADSLNVAVATALALYRAREEAGAARTGGQ